MLEINETDEVVVIRLNHGKVNAMDLEFCCEFTRQLKELEESEAKAFVLTGNERAFSAGVDLKRLVNEPPDYLDQFLPALTICFQAVFEFKKPMVAAINSHAIAGGCILASGCDRRLIHENARIGLPESRIGVPLPSLAVEIMRFVASGKAFQEMVSVGQSYQGGEAVDVGLADRLVDPQTLLGEAVTMAKTLTAIPEVVFQISKQQMRKPVLKQAEWNQAQWEDRITELWKSNEIRSVIREYVNDRL
ncbi:MAG: enoyl-CoA hydratase/isomerase family protein [Planctomycetota bacterium]